MKRILFTLIEAIISLTITAQDVAQWRGPNRNGIYNETGLMKKWPDDGPAMIWHFGGRSTPLVINDKLYFMTAFGHLFCLNTTNGQVIWTLDTFKEYGGRNIS